MSLWGNNDNIESAGTVSLNYETLQVDGSGTTFTNFEVGQVVRFGDRSGDYYGDLLKIISNEQTY